MTSNRGKYLSALSLLLIVSGLWTTGCERASETSESIVPNLSFNGQLSDGSFIGKNVTHLVGTHGRVYLNDVQNSRLLVLNDDFAFQQAIGASGRGPGEFQYVGPFVVSEDSLYAYDGGSRRIHVFTHEGIYERSIDVDGKHIRVSLVQDAQGYLYFSNVAYKNPITKIDRSGSVVAQFGDSLGFTNMPFQNRVRSVRHLALLGDSALVSVGESRPVIEIFSLDGQILRRADLAGHPVFRDRIEYADRVFDEEGNPRKTVTVTYGIAVSGDELYIGVIEGEPGDDLASNRVLVFDMQKMKSDRIVRMYSMSGDAAGWVRAIGIIPENGVVAYDATDASLNRYEVEGM